MEMGDKCTTIISAWEFFNWRIGTTRTCDFADKLRSILKKRNKILVPVHVRHHWILISLTNDTHGGPIHGDVYDSAPSCPVRRDVTRLMNQLRYQLGPVTLDWVHSPLQRSGTNECGLFVICNALAEIEGLTAWRAVVRPSLHTLRSYRTPAQFLRWLAMLEPITTPNAAGANDVLKRYSHNPYAATVLQSEGGAAHSIEQWASSHSICYAYAALTLLSTLTTQLGVPKIPITRSIIEQQIQDLGFPSGQGDAAEFIARFLETAENPEWSSVFLYDATHDLPAPPHLPRIVLAVTAGVGHSCLVSNYKSLCNLNYEDGSLAQDGSSGHWSVTHTSGASTRVTLYLRNAVLINTTEDLFSLVRNREREKRKKTFIFSRPTTHPSLYLKKNLLRFYFWLNTPFRFQSVT